VEFVRIVLGSLSPAASCAGEGAEGFPAPSPQFICSPWSWMVPLLRGPPTKGPSGPRLGGNPGDVETDGR